MNTAPCTTTCASTEHTGTTLLTTVYFKTNNACCQFQQHKQLHTASSIAKQNAVPIHSCSWQCSLYWYTCSVELSSVHKLKVQFAMEFNKRQ